MSRLTDKVAIITGGGNGLGRSIAQRMSEEGASIFILDSDPDGEKAVEELRDAGNKAAFQQCDVSKEVEVTAAVDAAVSHFGQVDILVNNAGLEGVNKPTDQFELVDWERVMSVNVTGVFLCTKHVIPKMRDAGSGAIVNISSIYGRVGGGDVPAYHASKGAVRTMSQNDAVMYAPENIRVNSIYPGFIPTSMVERFVDDSGLEMDEAEGMLNDMHPLGGMGQADDIAWGAVYLASDQARWVTGAELVIDGGYTAR